MVGLIFLILFHIANSLYNEFGEPAHLKRGLMLEASFRSSPKSAIQLMRKAIPACLSDYWDDQYGRRPSVQKVLEFYGTSIQKHLASPTLTTELKKNVAIDMAMIRRKSWNS